MNRHIAIVLVGGMIFNIFGCSSKKQENSTAVPQEQSAQSNTIAPIDNSVIQPQSQDNPEIKEVPEITAEPIIVDAQSIQLPLEDVTRPSESQIQQALKNAGLYDGKIDGKIGPKSKKAIEEFQAKNSLKVDGKVGPRTWEKLKGYLNPSPEGEPEKTAN